MAQAQVVARVEVGCEPGALCIADVLADCGVAEYEWLYTEEEMHHPDGKWYWLPLCEECCVYWREHAAGKPYRVRTLRRS